MLNVRIYEILWVLLLIKNKMMSGTFVNSIIILIRKSSVTGVHKLLKTLESELKNMDKYFNYRAKQNFLALIVTDKIFL